MAKRMLLVDATGLIFRAFYSIGGNLTTPDGTPINAVFGLVRMLMKLYGQEQPHASALIFDAGAKTFRNDIYADYKSHRPPPPPELAPQFGLSIETAECTMAPVYSLVGFEADDLIATIMEQARARGYKVTILTGDKDILQLVAEDVEVVIPAKRGEFSRWDLKAFDAKYGFPIERFVDFKALMGDPSDNIPGVPGIGEKTAAKLVTNYGKLEQLYGNIDAVKPPGVQKKLRDAKDAVFVWRDLVTLRHDAPVEYDFTARTLPDFGSDALQQKLADFGFNTIREDAKKLGDMQSGASAE